MAAMSAGDFIGCVVCAAGVASGQLLFKCASVRLMAGARFYDVGVVTIILCSFALYAITSLYWIWILQRVPLSVAYPFLALTYIIVPMAALFLFGEEIRPLYWAGVLLVAVGLTLIASQG